MRIARPRQLPVGPSKQEMKPTGDTKSRPYAERTRPALSERRRSVMARKRVSLDNERLKKNRKLIDHYLRRMGAIGGKELSLNSQGVSYFPYKRFIIVLEVPEDNPGTLFIYTMVCRISVEAGDNMTEVLKEAMHLNYMQYGTRGATLGVEGEEVNLCYSCSVYGLNQNDLRDVLVDFMQTSIDLNEVLDKAKRKRVSPVNR